ncbi:MAG: redoxin domain-containing protein [Thiotrichaceae bacterium]
MYFRKPKTPVFSILVLLFTLLLSSIIQAKDKQIATPAPEFTHHAAKDWINSKPLTLESLKGKVVLLDFWTFECWNCYRSFPWLNALEKQFAEEDFQIIGVHSPEFKHEHDRKQVEAKIKEFELHHPVMMDNDFSYWKALNNRYWPAYYLIDKEGLVQGKFFGETHQGDSNAKAIEALIRQLLAS